MKYLTLTGRIATPAAMVVFMTYEISRSMAVNGAWAVAVVIGAAATAIGVEIVGILSGHALEGFWRVDDKARALLAFALLMVYTVGAVYILRHNQTIAPVPIIAAVVYIVAALVESLEKQTAQTETAVSTREAFELEQERLDREEARRLKRNDNETKNAVKLTKAQQTATSPRQHPRQLTGNLPAGLPADWRQLTAQQRHALAHLTREERAQQMPDLADRTRRLWHKRLDEIAAKNGAYIQ